MSWKMVLLGDVIETLKGYAFKSGHYVESGVPIVRASNFTMDSISNDDLKFYTEDEATQFRKYELSTDDVLIQTVGSWESNPASVVGKVVRVPQLLDGALLNQNIVKVFPADKDQLDLQYLFYRLKCHDFKRHNIGNAVGAANQASITLDTIRAFAFLLPNIVEQRRIATILRGYDDLIENNQKQIKLLEEAAQRLYKEWFVDLRFSGHATTPITDGIPEGWQQLLLEQVAPILTGKKDANFSTEDGQYPFFTCAQAPLQAPSYSFNCDAVILAGNGDFNVKLYRGQFEAYQRTYVLSPENKELLFLLYHAVNNSMAKLAQGASGSTIKFLTKGMIASIPVYVPDERILNKFNELSEAIQKQIEVFKNTIAHATEARDRLLPKLMNGEIEV